ADQPMAKVMQPNTVHENARNEWVGSAGQPMRESETAAASRKIGILLGKGNALAGRCEHTDRARRNGFLWLFRITGMKPISDRHLIYRLGQHGEEIFGRFA